MRYIKKVLTIAGSDPSGGAGIQADLKTFTMSGVYGMSVITALTTQNTLGVQDIIEIPKEFVAKQIDLIMEDLGADAWKTGMLANNDIVNIVVEKAKKYKVNYLIVDPVLVSKSGKRLLKKDAIETLIKRLLPLSYLITPNLPEAQAIIGGNIKTIEEMKKAVVLLYKLGPKNILLKGGHLDCDLDAVDIFYDGQNFTEFSSKRIKTKNNHGLGCTLSAAIASGLAKGYNIKQAIKQAKDYVQKALKSAQKLDLGKGHGSLNHNYILKKSKIEFFSI